MRAIWIASYGALLGMCLFGFNGCGGNETAAPPAGDSAAAAHHDHGHELEGPHGGHVIELGSETYHAELTHDDQSHRVGVYILDGEAKAAVPIEAESVTINVSVDGEPSQYVLPAARPPGEAEGKSSYFELVSELLSTVVSGQSEKPNTRARVSITIDGKPYVGMIETEHHDHEHHDHDHDHDHAH